MSDIGNVSKESGAGGGILKGRGEEEFAPTESRVHEQFIKWISAHEQQVQQILCHSNEFKRESFCGEVDVGRGEDTFLWRGAAP
jgi:hypothetical protein